MKNCKSDARTLRDRPPGLIQRMLTGGVGFVVLVLLVPRLLARQGAPDCAPELAFALWSLGHLLGSAGRSFPITCDKWDAQHKFSNTRGPRRIWRHSWSDQAFVEKELYLRDIREM